MSRHNELLCQLLSQPPLPWLIAAAREHDEPVVLVGGAIRDALRSRPHADLDVAVAGDLEAFVDAFARHCGRRPVAIGDPWRDTHRARLGDTQVDIGKMLGTIAEDLARRDFTINAMAVRLDRDDPIELIDLHDGAGDLASGTIRMVSEAALREDPLRTLRAIRYFSTLDGFEIGASTRTAVARHAAAIDGVAGERVQAEWEHLLAGSRWAEASRLAFDLGVGEWTLGGFADFETVVAWRDFEATVSGLTPDDHLRVRLAALLCGHGGASSRLYQRLVERRWPAALARRATRIGRWARAAPDAEDGQLIGWAIEDRESASLAALLGRALAADDERGIAAAVRLETYAARAAETPWVRGTDLISWGMSEGPTLGAFLEQATRGQLERRWESRQAAQSWARAGVTDGPLGDRIPE